MHSEKQQPQEEVVLTFETKARVLSEVSSKFVIGGLHPFIQKWNKLGLALVTCYSRQIRMPSHYSRLLRDKPVCDGFLEKVHSIPVCLRFKAWKEKNKCWVLSPRFVILPGSGLLTTLDSSSSWSPGSAFPHHLLSERPASIPRWNILKKNDSCVFSASLPPSSIRI